MRRVAGVMLAVGVACCAAAAARAPEDSLDLAARAIPAFVFEDFGGVSRATLETNALPYKVVATALVMRDERARGVTLGRADIPSIYRRFGFLYPARIGNWPANVPHPRLDRPIGIVGHTVVGPTPFVRVDVTNLGCAACHSGPLYGRDGLVTDTAWIGAPNASINLEAYTQAVYQSLKLGMAENTAFRARIDALFPEMGWRERFTLRHFVLPRAEKRLRELSASGDVPLPFSNGAPGVTNGVAALKHMLGVSPGTLTGHPDVGFTSIPDLSGRALRSSLLYDGIYAPVGASRFTPLDRQHALPAHIDSLAQIVAFFTVPTMGVTAEVGERAIPAIAPVVEWIATRYASPPFPGPIDSARVRAGEVLFGERCASCHGAYASGRPRLLTAFPNRLVPQAVIGTDPAREEMIDSVLLAQLGRGAYARHIASEHTGGYVAPILSGLWASAPYLHNGSVPTLWQLMTPSERPTQFMVGGHALDYSAVGIAGRTDASGVYRCPAGYVPWSTPEVYDTRAPGKSSHGHERQFADLSDEAKRALIEYLKTL
jgi:mono/diheme cytochrome c family protein